jgi:hypothetical protein
VYAPEDPKVSAPTKVGVNTEGAGGKTRVSSARYCRVATLVAPQPLYQLFLSSVGAETWRSSGGVYTPEDPYVSAPTEAGVNTQGAGGKTRVVVTLGYLIEPVNTRIVSLLVSFRIVVLLPTVGWDKFRFN